MTVSTLGGTSKSYLFKISIPIFFSNIAVPLVGLVDTGLMGHLSNEKFLAAISIATSVITMVFWSFGFLRMGTLSLVSQSLGKRDYNEIILTIIRNLIIASAIGLVIIILKSPILFLIEFFFQTSEETQLLINEYISIRVFSAPAELIIYVLAGLYFGLQKTHISSLLISLFCLGNAIISSVLVIQYDLEIFGAALGTVIAAYTSVLIFLFYSYFIFKSKLKKIILTKKIIFNKTKLFRLFNINFDIFIRTVFLTFSFLWVTYQGSKLGENYLAVNTILMQFITLAAYFLDAYTHSTETLVGYSIGRGSEKSFMQVVKNSFQLSFFTAIVISILYFFLFNNIVEQLTNLDYLRYLSIGYMLWIIIIPPIGSICYLFDGIFIGAAQTSDMRNAMLVSVAFFILSSELLINIFANHGLWLSFLLFLILRSITLNYYFRNILKQF